MTVRRVQVERFYRFQRQFARTGERRRHDEFRAALDALVDRATCPPPPSPAAVCSPPVEVDPVERELFEQQVRDLLVRVHSRPLPEPGGDRPGLQGDWWSPHPVYGIRVWQLIGDELHGARLAWRIPQQTARCLRRGIDSGPVPHDVGECAKPPCGIYAVKDPTWISDLVRPWFRQGPVTIAVGVVALSGRVIEHDSGYRAEHAEVVSIAAIGGDERWVETAWIEGQSDLTDLFRAPKPALARILMGPTPTTKAFDIMFERVATHVDALQVS